VHTGFPRRQRLLLAFLPAVGLLFYGCTTSQKPTVSAPPPPTQPAANAVPATVQATPTAIPNEKPEPTGSVEEKPTPDPYALHHRVFPNLLFKSEGKFFTTLHDGEFERLREIISENYGPAYSKAMRMKSVSLPDIVFISFAEPARAPLCYHVALIKKGETFLYLTLEKSEDILSTGVKSAFCGWTVDGSHVNYGARHYTSLAEFEEEVRSFLAQQDTPKPAVITTPR